MRTFYNSASSGGEMDWALSNHTGATKPTSKLPVDPVRRSMVPLGCSLATSPLAISKPW